MQNFYFGAGAATILFGALYAFLLLRRHRFLNQMAVAVRRIEESPHYISRIAAAGKMEREVVTSLNHMAQVLHTEMGRVAEERDVLQHILQNMTTGVVYVGHLGRIQMMNQTAERMFRRPIEQSVGHEHWALFRSFFQISAAIDHALTHGEPWRSELTLRENTTVDVRLIPLPVDNGHQHGRKETHTVLVLVTDVSQWRRLEQMRSDFVANISHELKTPLTSIRGFAETLLDGSVDESTQASFLRVIYDEAVRMGDLVADLLVLSNLEAVESTMEMEAVSLNQVIDRAVQRLQGEIAKRELDLTVSPCGDTFVWGNEDRLLQVLLNLLSNAIAYTPSGGQIKVTCEVLIDRVKVHVMDTGIGIPNAQQHRVFERFYRVDRDRRRTTGGTGLGLSIVKHIVNAHGGDVGVTSTPGDGSDFWFTLSRLDAGTIDNGPTGKA